MSHNETNKPGPRPQSIRAEEVDWKDAMKHALDTPKPQDDSEQDKPQNDDQPKPTAD